MNEPVQDTAPVVVVPDTDVDGDFLNAVKLYESKSYSQAINVLLSCFEKDKTGASAALIGNCYVKLGSSADAVHYWQKAIAQNPTCYQAFLGLGNAAYSQNNIKQALIYWHIALSICPENPQVNYNIAAAYSRRDERFLSLHYYEKFLKYSNNYDGKDFKYVTNIILNLRSKAADLLKKASAAISDDKINLAVQYYIKAVKNYPIQPKVVQNIAKVFACDRNFDKAIEYYKMAIRIDDKLKICMVDIANAYMAKRYYELAYCYFTRFLRSYSRQSGTFMEIERIAGYAKSKMSADYDAIKHFNMAVEFENNLQYRKALDEYENYALLSTDNAERVAESIKKLKLMIYPERVLVKQLIEKIDEFTLNGYYEQAIALCDRVMVLAVLNSQEFHWASKKKQELRYIMYRGKEGKK